MKRERYVIQWWSAANGWQIHTGDLGYHEAREMLQEYRLRHIRDRFRLMPEHNREPKRNDLIRSVSGLRDFRNGQAEEMRLPPPVQIRRPQDITKAEAKLACQVLKAPPDHIEFNRRTKLIRTHSIQQDNRGRLRFKLAGTRF